MQGPLDVFYLRMIKWTVHLFAFWEEATHGCGLHRLHCCKHKIQNLDYNHINKFIDLVHSRSALCTSWMPMQLGKECVTQLFWYLRQLSFWNTFHRRHNFWIIAQPLSELANSWVIFVQSSALTFVFLC